MAEAAQTLNPDKRGADRIHRMWRRTNWLFLVVILSSVAGWQVMRLVSADPPLPVLETLGGDFSLASTRAGITRLSDFRGELVLLNFGYSGCPDVCPTVLARMRDLLAALPDDANRINPVFVTLDPIRDSVDRLTPYVGYFGESFVGMTGNAAEIDQAASAYKVYYASDDPDGEGITHSSHIYLLDPTGRVRATFGPNITVADMFSSVRRLLKEID